MCDRRGRGVARVYLLDVNQAASLPLVDQVRAWVPELPHSSGRCRTKGCFLPLVVPLARAA